MRQHYLMGGGGFNYSFILSSFLNLTTKKNTKICLIYRSGTTNMVYFLKIQCILEWKKQEIERVV